MTDESPTDIRRTKVVCCLKRPQHTPLLEAVASGIGSTVILPPMPPPPDLAGATWGPIEHITREQLIEMGCLPRARRGT